MTLASYFLMPYVLLYEIYTSNAINILVLDEPVTGYCLSMNSHFQAYFSD